MTAEFVYLASGSPRRRELLTQIGIAHRVVAAAVDESVMPGEAPDAYVTRLAEAKALAGWRAMEATQPVVAADTAVVLDGRILLKPRDRADGVRMLLELSARTHVVLTAVTVRLAQRAQTRLSRSEVTFAPVAAEDAQAYWATGEPADKAGGYAVQGRAAAFITHLRGSYSGVMGLPLHETAELLAWAGMPPWR